MIKDHDDRGHTVQIRINSHDPPPTDMQNHTPSEPKVEEVRASRLTFYEVIREYESFTNSHTLFTGKTMKEVTQATWSQDRYYHLGSYEGCEPTMDRWASWELSLIVVKQLFNGHESRCHLGEHSMKLCQRVEGIVF